MIGNKIFFIIFFFAYCFCKEKDSVDIYYDNGLSAYNKGQYDLAIQELNYILSLDFESPELYYNLGNAFYRRGEVGRAIWAYESCLSLSPSHSDAKYNLILSNLKVVDKLDLPEPPFYFKWYLGLKERFSSIEWFNISLFILSLFLLTLTIYRFNANIFLKSFKSVILSLLFVSLIFTIDSIITFQTYNKGIILNHKTEVRSEPNKYSTRLFQVNEGLKVKIINKEVDWLKVELLDGKIGWIEKSYILEI